MTGRIGDNSIPEESERWTIHLAYARNSLENGLAKDREVHFSLRVPPLPYRRAERSTGKRISLPNRVNANRILMFPSCLYATSRLNAGNKLSKMYSGRRGAARRGAAMADPGAISFHLRDITFRSAAKQYLEDVSASVAFQFARGTTGREGGEKRRGRKRCGGGGGGGVSKGTRATKKASRPRHTGELQPSTSPREIIDSQRGNDVVNTTSAPKPSAILATTSFYRDVTFLRFFLRNPVLLCFLRASVYPSLLVDAARRGPKLI